MADILQDFPIQVPPRRVFDGVSQPALLDQWWTLRSTGQPIVWHAVVAVADPGVAFELRLIDADLDWTNTTVRFDLSASGAGTVVRFRHAACIFESCGAIWRPANPCHTTGVSMCETKRPREAAR